VLLAFLGRLLHREADLCPVAEAALHDGVDEGELLAGGPKVSQEVVLLEVIV